MKTENELISPSERSRFNTLTKLAKMQRELQQAQSRLVTERQAANELHARWEKVRALVGASSDDTVAEVFAKITPHRGQAE